MAKTRRKTRKKTRKRRIRNRKTLWWNLTESRIES
ncbi:hypothetical protein EVA_19666 [gut metagenome]|uniref:Uncharacterized protein n=1 Tax=gut metagenome TaxID=749906 RepID=J9FRL9_9ZZZZ